MPDTIHAYDAIPKFSSLGIRRQALTHFSGIASGTDPDNITFAGLDSEKVVRFFGKMRDLYEKGARELLFSYALDFLSQ